MQQGEIFAIVRNQDAFSPHRVEKLSVVGEPGEAKIARSDDIVTGQPQRGYKVRGNILIEVEAGQRALCLV